MVRYYIIQHDQYAPFTVFSEVKTNFGSRARNFVKECSTYQEAEELIARLKKAD